MVSKNQEILKRLRLNKEGVFSMVSNKLNIRGIFDAILYTAQLEFLLKDGDKIELSRSQENYFLWILDCIGEFVITLVSVLFEVFILPFLLFGSVDCEMEMDGRPLHHDPKLTPLTSISELGFTNKVISCFFVFLFSLILGFLALCVCVFEILLALFDHRIV